MNAKICFTVFLTLGLAVANPASMLAASSSSLNGRILLQVEEVGQAWYVVPEVGERFYIRNGEAAYAAMRTLGLGITNVDLENIPIGIEHRFEEIDTDNDRIGDKLEEAIGTNVNNVDTDGDGFIDGEEILNGYNPLGSGKAVFDSQLVDRMRGQILLQVESRGEAWYVHPVDGMRYYMADGEAAYAIMQFLSLGISNDDLETVPLLSSQLDCWESLDCFLSAVQTDIPATMVWRVITPTQDGRTGLSLNLLEHRLRNADGQYSFIHDTLNITPDNSIMISDHGIHDTCTYDNATDMSNLIEEWISGTDYYSGQVQTFASCN